ncbi:glycosyltransferase family 2 protein [Priestia megaterium]|uniref:glycosyltransferase family 2 protein n=1 Tax=Priestia megaterium TaxID=1404 RepID=UPI002E22A046|nr:glycosyltransferase [Priestia megaterium]
MKMPLLSIIIPVYKAELYLNQCIESILKQTFKDFELILINDGSPDNSGEICDKYAKKDARIRVVHKKNQGVSTARNLGIDISKGKYLMFSDADDYVEPTWCEEMYNLVVNSDKSLVISGFCIHNNRKTNKLKTNINLSNLENKSTLKKKNFLNLYLKQMLNSPCNKIFISKLVKDNNIRFDESLSLGEDLLFNLEYLKKVDHDILIINKPLYNYILRNVESLDNKYYENLFEIYNKLYQELYSCMLLFKTDIEENKIKFHTTYLHLLNRVLVNTFSKKSKLSFLKKIKYNTMILKSNEFKSCLENSNLDEFNNIYINLVKLEDYFFVYIFNKLISFKSKCLRTFTS